MDAPRVTDLMKLGKLKSVNVYRILDINLFHNTNGQNRLISERCCALLNGSESQISHYSTLSPDAIGV